MSLVYENVIDKKFPLTVTQNPQDEYSGTLLVKSPDGSTLLEQEVFIRWGARYAVDIQDEEQWLDAAFEAIDALPSS